MVYKLNKLTAYGLEQGLERCKINFIQYIAKDRDINTILENISDVEELDGELMFNSKCGAMSIIPKNIISCETSNNQVMFATKSGYIYISFDGDWYDAFINRMTEYGYFE